jgi:hypothetical protein
MTVKQLRAFLLGGVGLIGALSPWIAPFFEFELISKYYQPALNRVASIIAVIATVTTLALLNESAMKRKRRVGVWCLVGAFVAFIICLVFLHTVGKVWAPKQLATGVVRVVWHIAYLSLFALLSTAICSFGMLIPTKETTAPRRRSPGK